MKRGALLIALTILFCCSNLVAQDRLVFNNEKVVECVVVEITPDLIKYTKYTMPDGPLYTVYKSEVNSIVFENGEIELISPVIAGQKSSKTFRNDKWVDSPNYRSSFGIDLFSPAFQEFRVWFERRNQKNTIGHTLTATGFWDNYGNVYYYYEDDFIDGYYYYPYGGGLTVGYMPKIYFIQHRIARPYFAPEVDLGFQVSDFTAGVFQATARFGVTINPTPRLNLDFNFGGGGYVVFDGFNNYGTGNMRAGLSIGMNYGKGKQKPAAE